MARSNALYLDLFGQHQGKAEVLHGLTGRAYYPWGRSILSVFQGLQSVWCYPNKPSVTVAAWRKGLHFFLICTLGSGGTVGMSEEARGGREGSSAAQSLAADLGIQASRAQNSITEMVAGSIKIMSLSPSMRLVYSSCKCHFLEMEQICTWTMSVLGLISASFGVYKGPSAPAFPVHHN